MGLEIWTAKELFLLNFLSFFGINCSQIDRGKISLETGNTRLCHCHGEANGCKKVEKVEWSAGEVGEIQHRVEKFISCTHGKENSAVSVVELHPVVAGWINKLMAGGALEERRVDVEPVTGDVDGHGQLEQEHEAGVEGGQGGEEAHGGAPVRQHVQHGPKLAALVQQSGSMTVQGIQKT